VGNEKKTEFIPAHCYETTGHYLARSKRQYNLHTLPFGVGCYLRRGFRRRDPYQLLFTGVCGQDREGFGGRGTITGGQVIDSALFKAEYERAIAKYPAELWANLHPTDMIAALLREVTELHLALWNGDLDGLHGTLRESCHVAVVATRISEEMRRRGEG
jgi:hypothetical protein